MAPGSTIDSYIAKQPQPQQDICQKLRAVLHATFPDLQEEMKWGVPTFAGGKFYMVALKDHVNLGFAIAGLSKEEVAQLQGSGKTMRTLPFSTAADIDTEKIVPLLKRVYALDH